MPKVIRNLKAICFCAAIFALALNANATSRLDHESGWVKNLSAWKFQLGENDSASEPGFNDSGWETVFTPHTLKLEPRTYKKGETFFRGAGWYRTTFSLGQEQQAGNLELQFEGVSARADLWLNGKFIGSHLGGFTPFAFDVTDAVKPDGPNVLAVKVDNRRMEVPPDGVKANIDYPIYGGIYRAVKLVGRKNIFIDDIYVTTPGASKSRSTVKIETLVKNTGVAPAKFKLLLEILPKSGIGKNAELKTEELTAAPGASAKLVREIPVEQPELWSPQHPALYRLRITVIGADQAVIDSSSLTFGIRSIKFTPDRGFFLNGEPVKLIGFNRHQFYPYLGNAVPDRYQRFDAQLIKDSGANFVRLSHYPQSPSFLDACDELGIILYEELPGWHYIGDDKWKDLAEQSLREMIIRDRSRPSIVLWGVRINESKDDVPFTDRLNKLAHELDPTRPTTGSRMIGSYSNYFEDVVSLNDYSVSGVKVPAEKPYLLSETVGVNYQAARYSKPDRVMTYIEWHLFILDQIYGNPRNAGQATWCIFDHVSFQTGVAGIQLSMFDNLWHWGVADAWRIPKDPYYVFTSQLAEKPFVRIPGNWDKNAERDVTVLHNCDEVELFLNGRSLGKKGPDKTFYPNRWIRFESSALSLVFGKYGVKPVQGEKTYALPHPPSTFKNVGFEPGELKAVCLVKGEVVSEHVLRTPKKPDRFVLYSDFREIFADGSDMTRVVVKLVDEDGTVVNDSNAGFTIKAEGPARILADQKPRLEAGMAAFFVQSNSLLPGEVFVAVTGQEAGESDKISVKLVPP